MHSIVQAFETSFANDSPTPQPAMRRGRILIADDDTHLRLVLAALLERKGHDVFQVDNGRDALAWYRSATSEHGHDGAPDVIVSGLQTPVLNGLQMLARLRRFGKVPPVILMSGQADDETLNRAYQLGAAAVILKPFQLSDLAEVIQAVL